MITKLSQLESGIYQDAAAVGLNNFLADMAEAGDISQELVDNTVAMPPVRQLMQHARIRVNGRNSTNAGVFFPKDKHYVEGAENLFPAVLHELYFGADTFYTQPSTPGDLLFPTDVRETFTDYTSERGMRVTLDELVSLTTTIEGSSYKAGTIEQDAEDALEMGRVAEGAELPLYTMTTGERSIEIYKYGGRVRVSYEFLRRIRLNKLARTLQGIRRKDVTRQIKQALSVALNGDGNANPAINIDAAGAAWAISDFDTLDADVNEYDVTVTRAVADKTEYLGVAALRYPTANLELTPEQLAMYNRAGRQTPNGIPMSFAPVGSVLDGSQKLLLWNPELGLERVVEAGSNIQETQRLIANQTEEITISENVGYAKPEKFGFYTLTRGA